MLDHSRQSHVTTKVCTSRAGCFFFVCLFVCFKWTPFPNLSDFHVISSYNMLNVVSQEHTKVGSADSQDIQLCGMGILAEHCVIEITADAAVVLTPYRNAR